MTTDTTKMYGIRKFNEIADPASQQSDSSSIFRDHSAKRHIQRNTVHKMYKGQICLKSQIWIYMLNLLIIFTL